MRLTATRVSGWTTGFGNLLDKELGSWWRTRRWLVHLVLWQAVIAGLILLVSLEARAGTGGGGGGGGGGGSSGNLDEVMQVFFQAGGFFSLIGAILVSQGAIVGERRSGTAAWVLTKPTTRKSFILSKLVAITGTFLLLSLVLPAISVVIVCQAVFGEMPRLAHYAEGIGILAIHQVFYIALTLMLGTFFTSRGSVAGAGLGFWLAGQIIPNFAPKWLSLLTPWPLAVSAASIAVWKPIAFPLWIPVVATTVGAVVAVLVALWRFEREEF
jgi:ABC-2 type transport system permease protein